MPLTVGKGYAAAPSVAAAGSPAKRAHRTRNCSNLEQRLVKV
jgi:hypothetical protein